MIDANNPDYERYLQWKARNQQATLAQRDLANNYQSLGNTLYQKWLPENQDYRSAVRANNYNIAQQNAMRNSIPLSTIWDMFR